MNSKKFFTWCRTAVGKIWYKPDRDAVHAELYAHMLDRYDGFMEKGCSPEEAERRTLRAMGDPDALAQYLKKVHNTFWAKTIVVTGWVIAALLLPFLVMTLFSGMQIIGDTVYHNVINPFIAPADNALVQKVTDSTDGYTITATAAAADNGYVYAVVKVESLSHLMGDDEILKYFRLCDSMGHQKELSTSDFETYRSGLTEYTYLIKLRVSYSQNPSWFQLCYDRAGRDVILHIDLVK